MTDNNSWQPPAPEPTPTPPQFGAPAQAQPPVQPPVAPAQYGPPQPNYGPPQPQYGQPAYGQPQNGQPAYGQPQYGQPQYGQPQGNPGQVPPQQFGSSPYGAPSSGWTPPPKPGLIPLRPLSFGTILTASFGVMRRNPLPTFGISLLLSLISYGLLVGVIGGVAFTAFDRVSTATLEEQDEIFAGAVGLGILAAFIPALLTIVVTGIMQGIIALEVARGTLGERLGFGALWRLARGRLLPLIGWAILQSVAIYGAIILVAVAATALGVLGGDATSVGLAILLGILGLIVVLVLAAWLSTKLVLVPSVLMLERRTLRGSIARSWSLTAGYFWKTLGILLLVNVILNVASQIISTPLSFLAGIGGGLLNPTGEDEGTAALLIGVTILSSVIAVVFSALTIVTLSAVASLIYVDARMRKEGLDIELTRFVEARQSGTSTVTNPYATADVTQKSAPPAPSAPGNSPWV